MEPWPTTMRESERCWHAVSSRLLPWCLWSAACQWQDLVKCNSSRLRAHMCRERQQIQIFPLYCHNAYFFFCQSVCLLSVCVGFVSVRLSVCHPICQFLSGIFHSSSAAKTSSFFYFGQMANSLMLNDLRCVVYCVAPGGFARTKWPGTLTGLSVMEPRCCIAPTERQNMQIYGKIL